MSSNNKTGLLSMCRKAGKLVMGMDMVKDACAAGTARAVFIADDLSAKSQKEVRYNCARYDVKMYKLGVTMDDIAYGVGKRTGVLAITDAGFAKSCVKGLEEIVIDINEFDI
ncbi:ribosomal L7Ae/L30e/S12e/Gadd45 family protein [uncultured Ruminococcus sp.]|uniref:L7Ae/L30e/S12e/Gadd45 family ribosomal protein n=1 Tax=uncultured Ruminococcus sp. TaxID=165186 RepID=UPI0025D096CE|nr:ribosomal L7Ae/L30e/S12e/Gadd45 family protein [uncultured Ruminococcus sp.]